MPMPIHAVATDRIIIETQLAAMLDLKKAVDSQVIKLQTSLGQKKASAYAVPSLLPIQKPERSMSSAARARIAAAQKRRWAEHRQNLEKAAKAAAQKPKPAPKAKFKSAQAAAPTVDLSEITG